MEWPYHIVCQSLNSDWIVKFIHKIYEQRRERLTISLLSFFRYSYMLLRCVILYKQLIVFKYITCLAKGTRIPNKLFRRKKEIIHFLSFYLMVSSSESLDFSVRYWLWIITLLYRDSKKLLLFRIIEHDSAFFESEKQWKLFVHTFHQSLISL